MEKPNFRAALQIREVIYRDTSSGMTHSAASAFVAIVALVITSLFIYQQRSWDRIELRQSSLSEEAATKSPTPNTPDGLDSKEDKEKNALQIAAESSRIAQIDALILFCLIVLAFAFIWQYGRLRMDKELEKHALESAFSMLEKATFAAKRAKPGSSPPQSLEASTLWNSTLDGCVCRICIRRPRLSSGAKMAIQGILDEQYYSEIPRMSETPKPFHPLQFCFGIIGYHILTRFLSK